MQKAYLIGILLLILLPCAKAEGLRIISQDGYEGLIDDTGRIIIPTIYERLGWSDGDKEISGGSIGYFENGKWGLIEIKSQQVSTAKYLSLIPFSAKLFKAGIRKPHGNFKLHGLIDAKARVVLPFKYYTLNQTSGDRITATVYDNGQLKYGLLGYDEEIVIPFEYEDQETVGPFWVGKNAHHKSKIFDQSGHEILPEWVNSIAPKGDNFIYGEDGYHGLIDASGLLKYACEYKTFTEDGVPVCFPEWQVVNLTGDTITTISCDSLTYNSDEGLLIAHVNNVEHVLAASDKLFKDQLHTLRFIQNGFLITVNALNQEWGIYKTDGREIASGFDSVSVDDAYFFAQNIDGWEIYNLFGRKLLDRKVSQVKHSMNRCVPIKKNDYWGWVDFQGNSVVDCRYEEVFPVGNPDYFIVKDFGHWGVSSLADEWLILPEYDSAYFAHGYFLCEVGASTHLYNLKGQLVHEIPYEIEVEDLILLRDSTLTGLVTEAGAYIYPEYKHVSLIDEGFYTLKDSSGLTLIDRWGKVILRPEDEVSDVRAFSEGYFHILKDGKHGFVDTDGKLRIANRYDDAQEYQQGLAPVKLLGKWGFIDKWETLIIQPFYENSSVFENGLAIVQIEGKYGLINMQGKLIEACRWAHIGRLSTHNYLVTDDFGKVGLIDAQGQFIIRPNYDSLVDIGNSLIVASHGAKKGLLNYEGYTVVPFKYQNIDVQGDYLLLSP